MQGVSGENVAIVLPAGHAPGWMERTGRKLKMEYMGMVSVFTVILRTAFGDLPHPSQAAIATAGTLFLFMGLKKKTCDHIAASLLLFVSAVLASSGVTSWRWFLPYGLFGACIWAMEGYLEKRRTRIYTLPVLLGVFAAISPGWLLGLAFVAAYLLEPRPEAPGTRRRLAGIVALSWVGSTVVAALVASRGPGEAWTLAPPASGLLVLYASVAVISIACLSVYWTRLAIPHRLNTIHLGLLAPLDIRILAMFGMASMVLFSATIFRHGIDSDRLRPWVRRAEWYFFPAVIAAALWVVFYR